MLINLLKPKISICSFLDINFIQVIFNIIFIIILFLFSCLVRNCENSYANKSDVHCFRQPTEKVKEMLVSTCDLNNG